MSPGEQKILLGCLSDPDTGCRIGFTDGCWVYATGSEGLYEVLARHESWDEFLILMGEYCDVEADGNDTCPQ